VGAFLFAVTVVVKTSPRDMFWVGETACTNCDFVGSEKPVTAGYLVFTDGINES